MSSSMRGAASLKADSLKGIGKSCATSLSELLFAGLDRADKRCPPARVTRETRGLTAIT